MSIKNYNLNFISDINIFNHVKETVEKYRFKIDLKKFNKNLIDPIKLTFDSKIYKKTVLDVIESEIIRQIDKSNTNHIGYFHQNIFKYFGNGWKVPEHGFDIVNESKNIYVEMKNKHNTMNSSSSQKTYITMQDKIIKSPGSKCYLVEIIATNSQNIPWRVSVDGNSMVNENIRRISIDKFYEIVTGDASAFKKLCEKLPLVLDDVIASLTFDPIEDTVIHELKTISPNILKSIYLLSFSKYEGFKDFNI